MVVSIGYSVITAFGFVWVCQPIAKYWDFSITTGKCINMNAYFLAIGCINAATDLALLVLPVFIIRILNLPWTRKIGVGLILMTGSLWVPIPIDETHLYLLTCAKRLHSQHRPSQHYSQGNGFVSYGWIMDNGR